MKQNQEIKTIKKAEIHIEYLKRIEGKRGYYIEDESSIENTEFLDCSFSGTINNTDLNHNLFRKCYFIDLHIEKFLFLNIVFDNCHIQNSCFKYSKISCTEFSSSKLLGLSFYASIASNVVFSNCNCQLGDFRETKLSKTVFLNCNLREADFQYADLRGVIFKNCDLREAQLTFAKLGGTNFSDSRIEGIKAQYENFNGAVVDYDQAAYLGAKFLKLKINEG